MTKLRVEKFEHEHIHNLMLRPEDKGRLLKNPEKWKQIADNSIAYSIFYGDEFIFCGGVLIYYSGVGEAWILCSIHAELFTKNVFKISKQYLGKIIDEHSLHRVQATVRCDWLKAQKFLERLGFINEGILHKYGIDQSNYIMYARIG